MDTQNIIKQKFRNIKNVLNERDKRRWAATEALARGWGGQSLVSRATGMDRDAIRKGIEEIKSETFSNNILELPKLRRAGAGGKK